MKGEGERNASAVTSLNFLPYSMGLKNGSTPKHHHLTPTFNELIAEVDGKEGERESEAKGISG